MSRPMPLDVIHVKGLRVWAHVGVLEIERMHGQWFDLEFSLWLDVSSASEADDLSRTSDYSLGIKAIQQLALEIKCLTIEHFSQKILDVLEEIYGPIKMRIILEKCQPPINGFKGNVSLERYRNCDTPI